MDEIYISAKNLTKSFGSRKPVPDNKINECGYDTDLLPHAAAEIRIHGVVWWNGSAGGCSDSYCSGLQRNRHQNFQMGVIH